MAQMIVENNNRQGAVTSPSNFCPNINEALEECQQSHNLYSSIRDETESIPGRTSALVRNYCSIGLHVNSAIDGTIRSIGHGGNMINRLRTMLTPEQRNEFSNDLHGMQTAMVKTYTECQAADQVVLKSLRQAVDEDPLLSHDPIAIQCVDTIEEYDNHLRSLPLTRGSLRERSNTIESMQSQLSILEERIERINPTSPLKKVLKVFDRIFEAMSHLMKGVLKSLYNSFYYDPL